MGWDEVINTENNLHYLLLNDLSEGGKYCGLE